MTAAIDSGSPDNIVGLLKELAAAGIAVWENGGRLHYRGPKTALTPHYIERLRRSQGEILQLLRETRRSNRGDVGLVHRSGGGRSPLAFTQLQHWNLYRLDQRSSLRFVSRALRLEGSFDIAALRTSLREVVRRHEALRTHVVNHAGFAMQEVASDMDCSIQVRDLAALPAAERECSLTDQIEQSILKPINVAVDPLWELTIFRLNEREHVLLLAMEHIITDMASIGIFLNELFLGYVASIQEKRIEFPDIPIQLADYAAWQRSRAESWVEEHQAYWQEHLLARGRLRFPEDGPAPDYLNGNWSITRVAISLELKLRLHEWCRSRGTTVVMSLFATYIALVLRWCGATKSVVQYISSNRTLPQIENTIGFFASPLHVPVELRDGDSLLDVLERTTEHYCSAHEHADFSYLESLVPRPEFTLNTSFNWVPHVGKLPLSELDASENALKCSPVLFDQPLVKRLERDSEPFIVVFDTELEAVGSIFFPPSRFTRVTMERFGANFLRLLEHMLTGPERKVTSVTLL